MSAEHDMPTQDAPFEALTEDAGRETKDRPWGRAVSTTPNEPVAQLSGNEIVFGRRAGCQVSIKHPAVSGQHCALLKEDDSDVVFVKDLSTNGTFVDGKKIGKGQKLVIASGTEVVLIRTNKEKISYFIYFGDQEAKAEDANGPEATYDIREILGTGAFATVKTAVHKKTGLKYAVKIIEKKKFILNHGTTRANALMDEVKILKKLNHKHIIKIFDVYETTEHLYIILELVTGGDLFDQIVSLKGAGYPEPRARNLTSQMLTAVQYLHRHNIVHRDIKPENILLATKMDDFIKLSDFGLSRIVGEGSFMKTLCGTPQYLAPEVLADRKTEVKGYDKAVDLWSIGVILYILLCGSPPFKDDKNLLETVKTGTYTFPPKLWKNVSLDAQDLVKKLLQKDPRQRIDLDGCMNHPWILAGGPPPAELVLTPPSAAAAAASSSSSSSSGPAAAAPRKRGRDDEPAAPAAPAVPAKRKPARNDSGETHAEPALPPSPRADDDDDDSSSNGHAAATTTRRGAAAAANGTKRSRQ